MRLYEMNYARLMHLLPRIQTVGQYCIYDIQGQIFMLSILEKTTYTTLLSIHLETNAPHYLKPELVVRLYHDARVAEVCKSQKISKIKPRYDYPNVHMHQKNEKHQVNGFLSDWLVYCLTYGTKIS